jgi:hypothetical protein
MFIGLLILNVVLPCSEFFGIRIPIQVLEIFLSLLLVSHIKFVPLLDVYQRQIPFVDILICSENI